jgi:hypothetical protein
VTHVFGSDGALLATWQLPAIDLVGEDAGLLYLQGGDSTGEAVFVVTREGEVIDTIRPPVADHENGHVRVDRSVRGVEPTYFYIPYAPMNVWAWSPLGYMVTGAMDRYTIELRVPRDGPGVPPSRTRPKWRPGDPVTSIRRDVDLVPIPDAQRDETRDGVLAYISSMSRVANVSDFEIPSTKPPYDWIYTGLDGRLWLRVRGKSERAGPETHRTAPFAPGWTESWLYDVFEPDGRYLGRVPHPDAEAAVGSMRMRGDTVWARTANADRAPIVVRYVIHWR